MTRTTSMCAATAVAALVLFARADGAVAQMAEAQRAPESVVAPADAAVVDTGLIGAAPAPAERGLLGEPAPPGVGPEAAPPGVAPEVEVDAAGPVEAVGEVEDAAADEGVEERPIGEAVLLGEAVPAPTRRSFLPAIRTAARMDAVPAFGSGLGLTGQAFMDQQLTHQRVIDAQLDTKFDLKALFAERGLTYPPRDIYLRLFKQEQVLEVWVRDTPTAETYTLLREYPICAIPGRLGPKTRTDDFQAPEGFYYIEGFNPQSNFHLSLRLNYPNPADRIIGVEHSPGGDIYIHGGCSTVGCFPMTDDVIAELYWLAVEARTAGQAVIPVHVFPARMTPQGMTFLRRTFERDARLVAFWDNLREGYEWFETTRRVPRVTVDPAGRYLFAEAASPAPRTPGLIGEELAPATAAAATPAHGLVGEEVAPGASPAAAPAEEPADDGLIGEPIEVAPAPVAAEPEPVEGPATEAPIPAPSGVIGGPLGAETAPPTTPAETPSGTPATPTAE